jgi:hypothetical protein
MVLNNEPEIHTDIHIQLAFVRNGPYTPKGGRTYETITVATMDGHGKRLTAMNLLSSI